jgi:hypothetical protein
MRAEVTHLQQLLLVGVVAGVAAQTHSVLGLPHVWRERINLQKATREGGPTTAQQGPAGSISWVIGPQVQGAVRCLQQWLQ